MTFKTATHTDILAPECKGAYMRLLIELTDWRITFEQLAQIIWNKVCVIYEDKNTYPLAQVFHKVYVTSDVQTYETWVTLYQTSLKEFDTLTENIEGFVSLIGGVAPGCEESFNTQSNCFVFEPKFNSDIMCASWKISKRITTTGNPITHQVITVERSLLIYIPENTPRSDVFVTMYGTLQDVKESLHSPDF
jgi:hypothetical protein